MYYIYIIRSKKLRKNYVGFSSNLKERISQHKKGLSRYTSQTNDWILVYYEAFLHKEDALSEEKFLKSGKGKERIKYLLKSLNNREVATRRVPLGVDGLACENNIIAPKK